MDAREVFRAIQLAEERERRERESALHVDDAERLWDVERGALREAMRDGRHNSLRRLIDADGRGPRELFALATATAELGSSKDWMHEALSAVVETHIYWSGHGSPSEKAEHLEWIDEARSAVRGTPFACPVCDSAHNCWLCVHGVPRLRGEEAAFLAESERRGRSFPPGHVCINPSCSCAYAVEPDLRDPTRRAHLHLQHRREHRCASPTAGNASPPPS